MSTLEQELAALKPGDHVCLLYEDVAEALAATAPFVTYGLARGEQCLYIVGESDIDQAASALAAHGVDIHLEQERGALMLWPTFDPLFPPGAFDPKALIAYLRAMAHDAVATGFAGLRVVADMTWTLGWADEHDKLIILEALWNELVASAPIAGVCQYSRRHFAPEMLRDVLRSHPLALLDGHLCRNLYYEPPSLVVDPAAVAERVDWMMAQLVRTRLAEESLQEAEARYRSIFESTSDGLMLLDPDGIIVEANPALCRMHGYSQEELMGQPGTMLIHPDHHASMAGLLHAGAADRGVSVGLVDRRNDGTSFHAEIRGTSFTYQDRPHLLWIVRDVTAEVEAQQLLEQRVAERTRELTTLLEVARSLASTLELEPLLELILEQLRSVVDYTAAVLRVLQGEDLIALAYRGPLPREQVVGHPPIWRGGATIGHEVLRGRVPVIIDDAQGDTPLARALQEGANGRLAMTFGPARSLLNVPLLLKERALGVLTLIHRQPGFYTERHAELAMAIANHVAVALENARLYQQVQGVAVAEERARIAREMHDNLAQMLFYVNTQAEAALTLMRKGQTEWAVEQLGQLAQAVRDAYTDVREDILALRTAGTTGDLLESLTTYLPLWQEQSGVRAELLVSPLGASLPPLSAAAQVQLVRIVQEALANVRKHARAQQAQIRITGAVGQVIVEVDDDGVGFDPTVRGHSVSPRFGLAMMRERAAAVDGELEVDSLPGRGTCVRVRLPTEATPRDTVGRD